MRTVIVQEFVTLEGFAAGPGDSVDYVLASMQGDQSFGARQMAFLDSIDRSGHFPYLDLPERFFTAAEEFLQGRWPAGAQVPSRTQPRNE